LARFRTWTDEVEFTLTVCSAPPDKLLHRYPGPECPNVGGWKGLFARFLRCLVVNEERARYGSSRKSLFVASARLDHNHCVIVNSKCECIAWNQVWRCATFSRYAIVICPC